MIRIAVTGSIGSGKSTVCRHLESVFKIPVFYSDDYIKQQYRTNQELKKEVVNAFGEEVYDGSGIDTKKLASIIFSDKRKLDKINEIVAPFAREGFDEFCKHNATVHSYAIMETALVYEHSIEHLFDFVVYVTAPEAVRIERVKKRDLVQESQVKDRLRHFIDEDSKILRADFVVDTFRPQIDYTEQCQMLVKRFPLTDHEQKMIMEAVDQKSLSEGIEIMRTNNMSVHRVRLMKRVLLDDKNYEKAAAVRDIERAML